MTLPTLAHASMPMMSAPSAASRSACERPWPRAIPVMKATLPSSLPMSASRRARRGALILGVAEDAVVDVEAVAGRQRLAGYHPEGAFTARVALGAQEQPVAGIGCVQAAREI